MAENSKTARNRYILTKQDAIDWFGDRGVAIYPHSSLTHWYWEDGKLWFIIQGHAEAAMNTDSGHVDITYTHTDSDTPVRCFELWSSVPIKDSPFTYHR